MADATSRAIAALEDIVAVEHVAPGMVKVASWSDAYVVDVREERCECPDMEYQLEGEGRCKHIIAARLATGAAGLGLPGIDLLRTLERRDDPNCPDCAPAMPCFEHDDLTSGVIADA